MSERKRFIRDNSFDWCETDKVRSLDWKKEDDYEFVFHMENNELAGEFLSRNQDFVKGFNKWRELCDGYGRELGDYPLSMPDKVYSERFAECVEKMNAMRDTLCKQFGLSKGVGDQHFDAGVPLFENTGPLGAIYLCQWVDGEKIPMFEDEPLRSTLCMDIRITAEENLEQQLQDVEQYYYAMKRNYVAPTIDDSLKKSRRQKLLYPDYIRIWDAYASGVRIVDIARELGPNNDPALDHDFITKRLNAAKDIVEGGYLKIAAHDFRK